jgi:DNA-binding LacI/PurR family transcriptional regulator
LPLFLLAFIGQKKWSDSRPTAILSAQNFITVGTLHVLYELGLPHDRALIGFDDFNLFDLLDPG